jgi:hypothetical protein
MIVDWPRAVDTGLNDHGKLNLFRVCLAQLIPADEKWQQTRSVVFDPHLRREETMATLRRRYPLTVWSEDAPS